MAKRESRRRESPPVPIWDGCDYMRVPEGHYQAVAVRWQGPEWVRMYSRWSLLVEFELLDDGSRVCAFYNFGNDPSRSKILRRGNYFKAWTLANGEPPRKRQPMSPDVFREGQIYTIDIRDNLRDSTEKEKVDAEIYSVVRAIVDVQRNSPNTPIRNQKSINQESLNPPIKQSTNQVGHLRDAFKEKIAAYQDSPVAGRM